jgi:hypothetical protein
MKRLGKSKRYQEELSKITRAKNFPQEWATRISKLEILGTAFIVDDNPLSLRVAAKDFSVASEPQISVGFPEYKSDLRCPVAPPTRECLG